MNAIEARALSTTSKSSATTALVTALDSAIQAAATKGNNKLECVNLIEGYSTEVVLEAYNQLRTLGFKVNPITSTIYWG